MKIRKRIRIRSKSKSRIDLMHDTSGWAKAAMTAAG
jgi:hypothetical protein